MEHLENAPESQSETEGEGALQGGGDIGFLAPGNAILDTELITGLDDLYYSQALHGLAYLDLNYLKVKVS